jgi:hypothetical protein
VAAPVQHREPVRVLLVKAEGAGWWRRRYGNTRAGAVKTRRRAICGAAGGGRQISASAGEEGQRLKAGGVAGIWNEDQHAQARQPKQQPHDSAD